MHIAISPVDTAEFSNNQKNSELLESSKAIKQRVVLAREKQEKRFENDDIQTNAQMKNAHIKKYCKLTKVVEGLLRQASLKFQLSARAYMKMIKVARTIADLEGAEEITISHMAEALQYKSKIYESS